MKVTNYTPTPLELSDVSLPEELEPLKEQIAKNVHEVWAYNRIRQGWSYGKERNDQLKTHPSIRPYEELSDEEKDYDRNTSLNTLKLIIKLGFRIEK